MHQFRGRAVRGAAVAGSMCLLAVLSCSSGGTSTGGGLEIPPFVDSGAPEFAGGAAVPKMFFVNFQGQKSTVALPSGVGLSLSSLRVVSAEAEVDVKSDGSVEPFLPGAGGFLTPVLGPNDKVVLLGYSTTAGVATKINSESTALVLLYFAMGTWTIPNKSERDDAYRELQTTYSDITNSLKTAIEEAMRGNPYAVNDKDPKILTALASAKTALLAAGATQKSQKPRVRQKTGPTLLESGSAVLGFVTTDPPRTVEQSGLYLRTSTSSDGVTPLNRNRREGKLYVFLTGVESPSGARTAEKPIKLDQGPLNVKSASLSSEASFVTAANAASTDWEPAKSDPVILAADPKDAATFYDIVVVGPALDAPSIPAVLEDERFDPHRDALLAQIDDLEWKAFLLNFMVPVIDELGIGAQVITPPTTTDETVAKLRAVVEPFIEGQGFSIKTTKGYEKALTSCLAEFKTNTTFRDAYFSIMKRRLGAANGGLDLNKVVRNVIRLLDTGLEEATQEGIEGPDLGSLFKQLQNSREADLWHATISTVTLQPSRPEIWKQQNQIRLAAKVASEDFRTLCYHWSTPGAYGQLAEIKGSHFGKDFHGDQGAVYYTVPPNLIQDGDLDTVSVKVYDVTDVAGGSAHCSTNPGQGVLMGTASVTVRGNARPDPCENFDVAPYNRGPISMSISPTTVLPGEEVTVTVSYDFSQTTASAAQVLLYLPRACNDCAITFQCICGAEEMNNLLFDGGTNRYNVQQQQAVSGIGRTPNLPGLRTECAWELQPVFTLPDPNVHETITHEFTYVFNKANWPCQTFGCYCPELKQDPQFVSEGMVWFGNFVMASEVGGGANGLAVQLLDVGVDKSFDPDATDPCKD